MEEIFSLVLASFGLDPAELLVRPLGEGHIHDTFLVEHTKSGQPPLVLQRINHHVFPDVPGLMHNLERVTSHIALKNRRAGKDPAMNGLLFLEAEGGISWVGGDEMGYWRLCWYLENQFTYQEAPTTEMAEEGGRAVAGFQDLLSDLDPSEIMDVIPGFHDLQLRARQFDNALASANGKRLEKAREMIGMSHDWLPEMLEVYRISAERKFPERLTHNDTKFNNILFNAEGRHTCMIDLDTVMRGYAWFDFADALRTCANTAPEDEADTDRIGFRMDIYEAFASGFVAEGRSYLTGDEIGLLHRAPAVFAFMQGLRFLTDYLNGDVYYKTLSSEHNLQRCRAQYTLMQRIVDKEPEMAAVIGRLYAG